MISLHYLAHLATLKNTINRRRRRFYAIANPGKEYLKAEVNRGGNDNLEWIARDKPMHHAYSKMEASRGYAKACKDMRQLTKPMKQLCKSLNARIHWDKTWTIITISHEGKRYDKHEIQALTARHIADDILLGDKQ